MPYYFFIYSALYYIATPVLLLRMLLRSRHNKEYRRRLNERFGIFDAPPQSGGIHFHLVSVGETMAALDIVKHYLEHSPDTPIYITSTTPTGSAEVRKNLGDRVFNIYLPFDLPDAMVRFYKKLRPRVSIMMETELWPNMLWAAEKVGCKAVVMNARLSQRSAISYDRVGKITQFMMNKLVAIAAQNDESAERFVGLGFPSDNIITTGNVKYDVVPAQDIHAKANVVRQALGEQRPVWLAGSTHIGEDEIIFAAHKIIKESYPDALLMVAPRHPERFDNVAALAVDLEFNTVRRSLAEPVEPSTDVYICDSLGELQMLYGAADVCFIGGSLINVGGHNPIEAIVMGCPVISGPKVFNFDAVYRSLDDSKAVIFAPEARDIADHVVQLLGSQDESKSLADRALNEVKKHQGARARTIEFLDHYMLSS